MSIEEGKPVKIELIREIRVHPQDICPFCKKDITDEYRYVDRSKCPRCDKVIGRRETPVTGRTVLGTIEKITASSIFIKPTPTLRKLGFTSFWNIQFSNIRTLLIVDKEMFTDSSGCY